MKVVHFKSFSKVKEHIKNKLPTFYYSSQTSTVIPYEKLDFFFRDTFIGDLSGMESRLEMIGETLHIEGAVTWSEARSFCRSNGREIMTSPTEELAMIGAGVSTSATGERCFGHGTIRDQIEKLIYIDQKGDEVSLESKGLLKDHPLFLDKQDLLKSYQLSYVPFLYFKNAPFPRLEFETDLMIGSEGQLGVVKEVWLKTMPWSESRYFFIDLPKWEDDYSSHLEIFNKVQLFRHCIFSCELIDSNSKSYLPHEKRVGKMSDLIFLEIKSESLEEVIDVFFSQLESVSVENIFEVNAEVCRAFRMNIPRYIFEKNAKMSVVKKGTDAQVPNERMKDLFDLYRKWGKEGIEYNLFGHFGDAHLHFNFIPKKEEENRAQQILEELYERVLKWQGSPFAEHGIGIMKQHFIRPFYHKFHYEMFKYLKREMDAENIFFPQGFMNLEESG